MAAIPQTVTHSAFYPNGIFRLFNDALFSSDCIAWNERLMTAVTACG
jgi:hypothetical protein